MLYDCLKIFHILSAGFLLSGMIYSYYLWRFAHKPQRIAMISQRIQIQTLTLIAPLALVQLATGFTMVSLQSSHLSQWWITASILGFVLVLGSWFSFVYLLVLSQQVVAEHQTPEILAAKYKSFRRAQSIMLWVCAAAAFCMIFFMANKVETVS